MIKGFLFPNAIKNIELGYNTLLFFFHLIWLDIEQIIGDLTLALGMLIEYRSFRSLTILEEGSILVLAALARSGLFKEKTHYNILTKTSRIYITYHNIQYSALLIIVVLIKPFSLISTY